MAKLHEILAAEKTPTAAWNAVREETLKKFGNPSTYFEGHSKSLSMIEETPENRVIEQQARDEKPVTTTVLDTLEYALDLFAKAEDLQVQKNCTNQKAVGTVMWNGTPLFPDLPIDELLGLEARLGRIREVFAAIPTLDATKHWVEDQQQDFVYVTRYPEETTKTDKRIVPVVLHEASDKHPAQVQAVTKDVVVGKFTTIKRSGAATSQEKADMLKHVDALIQEVKQARMRANEHEVVPVSIGKDLVSFLLEPLKS